MNKTAHARRFAVAIGIAALLSGQEARAWGPNDLISTIIQAGAKIGGAVIDKAVDSLRDPEAEKRKKEEALVEAQRVQAAQFQKLFDSIEARKELTPLQREKLKLTAIELNAEAAAFAKFAQDMEVHQQEQRRAEADRVLSLGGLVGTIGEAAMNSPTMVMNRANALSRSPEFRQQTRDAVRRADGQPSGGASAVVAAVEGSVALDAAQSAVADARERMVAEAQPVIVQLKADVEASQAELAAKMQTSQRADFFTADRGRKVFVDFLDNAAESERLRGLLAAQGHQIVATADEAEVRFRIEGEYEIPATGAHEGVVLAAGSLLDRQTPIEPPPKKSAGIVGSVLGALFRPANAPTANPTYPQRVLLVASRQAPDAPEIRVSALRRERSAQLDAGSATREGLKQLYEKLGIDRPVPETPDPAASVAPAEAPAVPERPAPGEAAGL